MASRPRRRRRVEPTEDWEQIELFCGWPEQRDYELIRPLVLFGGPASDRAAETGAVSERTLRRRAARFEAEVMESLFGSEAAKRKRLPSAVRRLVVDLKAEYPGFNPNEISRVLALNLELYGLEKPKGPVKEKKEMPFAARRRHQFWSADVRYLKGLKLGGRAYVISVLDNHSRAVLASAVTRTQDLASYLSVLYAAVEKYGAPEALVTDGGGIFRARQARAVYEALGIAKHEIERGRPWQNYVETQFNVQRRMADWHLTRAASWAKLAAAHGRFVEDYNAQAHFAHVGREDGRRSPAEVLGFASGVRHREEELRRAFFSARFVRVLDALGYTRFRHWRLYGEEALAGKEAALWLAAESLTGEHAGEPLSRYEVRVEAGTGELRSVVEGDEARRVRAQGATAADGSSADAIPVPRSLRVASRSKYAPTFGHTAFYEVRGQAARRGCPRGREPTLNSA